MFLHETTNEATFYIDEGEPDDPNLHPIHPFLYPERDEDRDSNPFAGIFFGILFSGLIVFGLYLLGNVGWALLHEAARSAGH